MNKNPEAQVPTQAPEITSIWVFLARLFWVILGPMTLLLVLLGLILNKPEAVGGLDAFYAIVVLLMLGGRWIEQRSAAPKTASGELSTPESFRRYIYILIPVAIVAWVAARVAVRLLY